MFTAMFGKCSYLFLGKCDTLWEKEAQEVQNVDHSADQVRLVFWAFSQLWVSYAMVDILLLLLNVGDSLHKIEIMVYQGRIKTRKSSLCIVRNL